MTIIDWTAEIAKRCSHLAGFGKLPPPMAQHSALQALAVLSITAEIGLEHALTPASTMPILETPNATGRHELADELLGALTQAIAAPPRGHFYRTFSATTWLEEYGLDELVLSSVHHTADDTDRCELLGHAARKALHLMKEQDRLCDQHMRALLARDTPDLDVPWHSCNPAILAWILDHEHDGHVTRAVRVERRLQALCLYGSIDARLREPAITEIIDAGRELVPALTQRLALTKAQLCALREASTLPDTITGLFRHNFEHAVRHLQAHAVPLHQWPGGGRPGQHTAWQASPWLTNDQFTLIPADYYGTDATTVADAVRAFSDDLLAPLLAEYETPDGSTISPPAILSSLQTLAPNNNPAPDLPPAQQFVEEGNAHHHCVGTYYDACRSGTTQILSLRSRGKPMVTAEILMDPRIAALRVGQFKGLFDEVPSDPAVHQAMREFLHDLRTGIHPLNRQELRAYRQWADEHIYGWTSAPTPTLAHAREAFPLYLALLPRGTPADFDLWCNRTGLRSGLSAALRQLTPHRLEAA